MHVAAMLAECIVLFITKIRLNKNLKKTLFGIEELQHKRTSCNNARATRQEVPATVNQFI